MILCLGDLERIYLILVMGFVTTAVFCLRLVSSLAGHPSHPARRKAVVSRAQGAGIWVEGSCPHAYSSSMRFKTHLCLVYFTDPESKKAKSHRRVLACNGLGPFVFSPEGFRVQTRGLDSKARMLSLQQIPPSSSEDEHIQPGISELAS